MKTAGKVIVSTLLILVMLSMAGGLMYYSGTMYYMSGKNPLLLPPGWNVIPGPGSAATSTVGNTQCDPSSAQPVYELISHYDSDTTISNLAWARYSASGATLVQVPDSPGTLTDTTKSSSASGNNYKLGSTTEFIHQSTTTYNVYPMWVQPSQSILTNPISKFGQIVFSVQCQGSASNSNVFVWSESAVLFEAPTSGTSATTYAKAVVQYPGATPTAFPTSAATWNIQLQGYEADKVGMLHVPLCGTVTAPVQNYATGTVSYGCNEGPGQGANPTVSGFLFIVANQTGLSVSLAANAAPGTTLNTIGGNQLSSGTRAWIVSVPEAGPAPGSGVSTSAPYLLANVPLSIYETATQGTSHGEIVFWFVDMQQAAYVQQYLIDPAASGSWASATAAGTSSYGAPTGISGLTPTSGQNAGSPAVLIELYVAVILTY